MSFWKFRKMAWDRPGKLSVIPVFCIIIVVVFTIIITALLIKLAPIHGSQAAGFNCRTTEPVRLSIMVFYTSMLEFFLRLLHIMFVEICVKKCKACNLIQS